MVGARKRLRAWAEPAILALVVALLLVAPACCLAQEDADPTITEEYTVTLNPVGDARIVDTITYSDEDFEAVKNVEDENKGFLTRRFETDDNRGEMVDFDVKMNETDNTVVITYDKPGFAYYTGGEWAVFGISDETPEQSGHSFTFEEQSTTNSEFTLFTDQEILTTTKIELPEAASGQHHDPEDDSIKYEMPAAGTLLGFWSDNKATLSIVFGLCALVFSGLLLFVATRKTAEPTVAAAGSPAPGVSSVQDAPAAPGPAAQEAPVTSVSTELPAAFCGKCGKPISEGKKFCPHCGAPR